MKIYVGNLPKETTDTQLNELALPYGTPEAVNVATDRDTGAGKGFGFVQFANEQQGRAAIAGLDKKEINGLILKASEARSQKVSH